MSDVCQTCQRRISFRERSRGIYNASRLGVPRGHCAKLMPRCPECLLRHVNKHQLTPGACIRALSSPVATLQVPTREWDALHNLITSQGALYCAARMSVGDTLAVVTTARLPEWKTTDSDLAAQWIERYIARRPTNAVPRFVASPEWDHFAIKEETHEGQAAPHAGSAVQYTPDSPLND